MNCPVCNVGLDARRIDKTMVAFICPKCDGAWLEKGTIKEYIEEIKKRVPAENNTLIDNVMPSSELKEDIRLCPKCSKSMAKMNYLYDSNIFLDKCPACEGIWADSGELYKAATYSKGNAVFEEIGKNFKKESFRELIFSDHKIQKLVSLSVVIVYLIITSIFGDGRTVFDVSMFGISSLACIWFGDEMGNFIGIVRMQGITKTTPGGFVRFMGWVLLLMPIWVALLC